MARKSIKWDVTTKCNLHCSHCSVGKEYFVDGACEMPVSSKLEVIDKLADGGVGAISLLGGEPLTLGDGLLAIIQRAVERGIKMSLVTNGLLLEGKFMERLVASGLNRIVISIEGATKETHEAIRGKGTFEKLMNNLLNLKRCIVETNSSLSIGINTVLSRKNLNEIEKLFDLLDDVGVNEWTLLSLGDVGYAKDNIDGLAITPQEEIDTAKRVAEKVHNERDSKLAINPLFTYPLVWDYIEKRYGLKMNKPRICCTASMSLGFVSPDGHLYPCDRISKECYVGYKLNGVEIKPMSLLNQSFYDIWNSEYFVKMFNFILSDSTYKNYRPCNRCVYFKKRFCTPCPLYSLTSKVVIGSCAIVEKEMGASFEKLGSSYQVDELFGFEKASVHSKVDQTLLLDQLVDCVPKKKMGVRSFESGESLLLLNPQNIEYASLNLVGKAIWELIDGQKTVGEICKEINESVDLAFGKILVKNREEIHIRLTEQVMAFIEMLAKLDLIVK
jgi:MoaA/NifB/PqqE/SkfB family radical SAM enzyme